MKRSLAALLFALAIVGSAYAAPPTKAQLAASEAKLQKADLVWKTDQAAALPLFEQAAQLGQDPDIAYMLALIYQNEKEREKEARWMKLAADWGHVDARFEWAKLRIQGIGTTRDVSGGLQTLEEMARAGYAPAVGKAREFRSEQDAKAQCLMRALREKGYEETIGGRFYRIDEGQNETSRGDVFVVRGLLENSPSWAFVRAEGFDGVKVVRSGDNVMFSSTYNPRPVSSEGIATVATLHTQCDLDVDG